MIAKYGRSWRGIKPKVAAEHGAVGCLIYSDPRGRRLPRGRHVPGRPIPPAGRRAARQRDGHAALRRRPADPRRSARRRTRSGSTEPRRRRSRRFQSSRSPGPMRNRCSPRSAAGPRRPGGPGDCRSPITSGPALREVASQAPLRLADRAGVRRDRPDPRRHPARRMGRAGQSPRRLGQRRRGSRSRARSRCSRRRARTARSSSRDGGRGARSCSRCGTAKSRCCSAAPNGRRPTPTSSRRGAVAYLNTDGNGRGRLNVEGSPALGAPDLGSGA